MKQPKDQPDAVRGTSEAAARAALELLIERSYKTYRSRLEASQRLARSNGLWNFALVFSALVGVLGSVVSLADESAYDERGDVLLVAVGIISLVTSLVVASLGLGARSRNMFVSYRRTQRISAAAERLLVSTKADPPSDSVQALCDDYDDLLDDSENHTSADYYRAFPRERPTRFRGLGRSLSDLLPLVFSTGAAVAIIPAICWLVAS